MLTEEQFNLGKNGCHSGHDELIELFKRKLKSEGRGVFGIGVDGQVKYSLGFSDVFKIDCLGRSPLEIVRVLFSREFERKIIKRGERLLSSVTAEAGVVLVGSCTCGVSYRFEGELVVEPLGDRHIEWNVSKIHKTDKSSPFLKDDLAKCLLDVSLAMVIALDRTGRATFINRQACKLTGFAEDEVIGKNWFDVTGQSNLEIVKQDYCDAMNGRREIWPDGYSSIITKSGEMRSIHWCNTILYDDKGVPQGVLSSGEDLTEKEQLERQLRQAEKMRAIGQLAGGIAHDFNNQLTGIIGNGEILEAKLKGDPELQKLAIEVLMSAKHSANLTAQLLSFSRQGKYLSVEVSIHDLILEVISMLRRTIERRISISFSLDSAEEIVLGDPTQLQNALLNLAINARDAMPNGGELTIRTELTYMNVDSSGERKFLKVTVKDTGVGIPPENIQRVFEPFFTTKDPGQGTGMGLASVYGAIQSHGGFIEVESLVGHGTEFLIFLPVARKRRTEKLQRVNEEPRNSRVRKKIIFVDDELSICELAKECFQSLGDEIDCFSNSQLALDHIKGSPSKYDLAIVDMIMPGMSGAELFKEFRKIDPKLCIVVSSGYCLNGEIDSLLRNDRVRFMQKPYSMLDLSAVTNKILAEYQ